MKRLSFLALIICTGFSFNFAQETKLDIFTNSVEGTKIKSKPGRHVCTTQKTISRPIQVVQTYRKPVYTPKPRECPNTLTCPQFDVSYTLANRTVYQLQKSSTFQMNCCPGWTKEDKREKGCMQPICKTGCGDYGVCIKPETCDCTPGYTGPMCDTDIDECLSKDHGCQHQCKNTAGSYLCACQEGFSLAPDGKTCLFCFTCQKEYQDLVASISAMSNSKTVIVNNSDEVQALNLTIHELRNKVISVTEENKKLREEVQSLEQRVENASVEIALLQNLTRTTTPAPTTSTTTTQKPSTTTTSTSTTATQKPSTTTTSTSTTSTTTTTTSRTTSRPPTTPTTTTTERTTTPAFIEEQTEPGLQFDTYDLIVSLSNQIGLMEEKLELCQCTYKSGRGYG